MIKEEVLKIVEERKKEYELSIDRLISDYNKESQVNEGYNGRQFLELIQNCDDQGAERVRICLDTHKKTLTISNTGEPFSLEGYKSLTLAHLSPKQRDKRYIGNKGLGFRALINWSETIKIFSNGFCTEYSEQARSEVFESLYSIDKREEILRNLDLDHGSSAIPFLALPKLTNEEFLSDFTTSIVLLYKVEFEEAIRKQLSQLSPNALIFLQHIQLLEIDVNSEIQIFECHKTIHPKASDVDFTPVSQICIGEETWDVFLLTGSLPKEFSKSRTPELFEVKLALNNSMSTSDGYLYSYLRTNIRTNLPYLLHGTFDLDQSRDYLNNTEKNRFVIGKVVELIVKTALYHTNQTTSWLPVRLLREAIKNSNNERLGELDFYNSLEKALSFESVFPCVDGRYRPKSEVKYWSPEFSELVLEQGWENLFPNTVIPPDGSVNINEFDLDRKIENIDQIVSILTERITDIDVRANLIYEIWNIYTQDFSSLFLNQDNKHLATGHTIYTPSKEDLKIPSYCSFTIIQTELFETLKVKFGTEGMIMSEADLQQKLTDIVSIEVFNRVNIAREIVRQTNDFINDEDLDYQLKKDIIIEQLNCLYEIEDLPLLKDYNVCVINQLGEIKEALNLFLSEEYESGKTAISIIGHLYEPEYYVATPQSLDLPTTAPKRLEEFLLSLGVNRHVRAVAVRERALYPKNIYSEYFDKHKHIIEHVQINNRYVETQMLYEFEKVFDISEEKLLALLHYDKQHDEIIWKAINSKAKLYYETQSNYSHNPSVSLSVLKELFQKHIFGSEEFLIEPPQKLYNEKSITYKHPIFSELDISRTEINHLLLDLGAVDEFDKLSKKRVELILEKFHREDEGFKHLHSLYKKVLSFLKENKIKFDRIKLLAQKSSTNELLINSNIYYSQRRSIPKNLREKYPVLYLPRDRSTELVTTHFGVQSLDNIQFQVTSMSEANEEQSEFEKLWRTKKPYLLCARLKDVDKDDRQVTLANKLNELKIKLCHEVIYLLGEESGVIDDYEYIQTEDLVYILRIPTGISGKDLFDETRFNDVIAEILGLELDVRTLDEFKLRLKDRKSEISYVESKYGIELVQLCQKLIGEATTEWLFWKPVIILKEIEHSYLDSSPFNVENLLNQLGLDIALINFDYSKAFEGQEYHKVKELLKELGISLSSYNLIADRPLDYSSIHERFITDYLRERFDYVVLAIYHYLKSNSTEKRNFLHYNAAYKNGINKFAKDEAMNFDEFDYPLNNELLLKYVRFLEFPEIELTNTYEQLKLDEISNEKLARLSSHFSEEQIQLIKDNPELLSLTYFDVTKPFFDSELNRLKSQPIAPKNTVGDAEIVIHKNSKVKSVEAGRVASKKASKVTDTEKNKKIGDNSELNALHALIRKYGEFNVRHVSQISDNVGYDIEYRRSETEAWRLLDIKTSSMGGIHISRNQYLVAIEDPDRYDIGIYYRNENRLEIFESLFQNVKEHELSPSEYILNLEAVEPTIIE